MKAAPFLLLLISISISISTTEAAALAPVFDLYGKPLRSGEEYYVVPVVRGRGGGLTLGSTGNKTCPLDVLQEPLEVKDGLPLIFHPTDGKRGAVVRISTDHNIKFSASSICVQSTVWKLELDESIQKYVITTGGVEGNPGRETISNWFKIEKYNSSSSSNRDYKLFFCPTVCDFCKVICRDVGVVVEDGVRRLSVSLTDDITPFRLNFKPKKKAPSSP